MQIHLGLLSFLIVFTAISNAYAEDGKNSAANATPALTTNTAPEPAKSKDAAVAAAPATPVESPEPTAFVPLELPIPIMAETVASPAKAEAIATPIKVEPIAKPAKVVVTTSKPTPKKITTPIALTTTDTVAEPKPATDTAAAPKPVADDATEEKITAVNTNENPSEPEAQPQEVLVVPTHTIPIVDSVKASGGRCANRSNNHFQKSLLVMAFPRLTTTSSNAGELYQVEQQLPELLSQLLVTHRSTIEPVHINQALPSADATNDAQLALLTQRLASNYRSQFILSGEIIDMSMTSPDATYNPSLYNRSLNTFFDTIEAKNRFDKRDRLFSFQLHLRDGFTGQELLTKRYDTYGIWSKTGKVGFGTPLFWKSDYGQQIKSLVTVAAKELSQTINCQPLIAHIDSRPGQTQFILQSGTNNGLHTGDTLSLYQLIIQGSETRYQEHDVRLVNRNVAIELREVYASHSVGVINSTTYLTGQLLAVAK